MHIEDFSKLSIVSPEQVAKAYPGEGFDTLLASVSDHSESSGSTFDAISDTVFVMAEKEDSQKKKHLFSEIAGKQALEFRWVQGPQIFFHTPEGIRRVMLDATVYFKKETQEKTVWFRGIQHLPLDISIAKNGEKWVIALYAKGMLKDTLKQQAQKLKIYLEEQLGSKDVSLSILDQES